MHMQPKKRAETTQSSLVKLRLLTGFETEIAEQKILIVILLIKLNTHNDVGLNFHHFDDFSYFDYFHNNLTEIYILISTFYKLLNHIINI